MYLASFQVIVLWSGGSGTEVVLRIRSNSTMVVVPFATIVSVDYSVGMIPAAAAAAAAAAAVHLRSALSR
jgi:hypothetical protein